MATFPKLSNFRLVQVAAFAFILSRCITVADECVKQDACTCKTKTRTVDLHSLDLAISSGQPRFKDVKAQSTPDLYSFNPCTAFTDDQCINVAACQHQGTFYYPLGSQDSVQMSGDPDAGTLVFQYTSTDQRIAKVKIICDYGTNGQLTPEGEGPTKTYTLTLKTNLICPPSSSLSVGSVLVILFFVLLIIYWVGGILFLRFVRKAQGAEMIPNYDFWTDFPFLIRDGVLFVFRGCKAESTYEKI